jgi:hypothetical protein
LITNSTDNIIIFNFASPGAGGIVSGNILTLQYDTSSMDNNDKLQIFYEDPAIPATEELLELLRAQIESDTTYSRQLLQLLKPLSVVTSGTGRLAVDVTAPVSLGVTATLAANQDIRTVASVTAVNNQINMGGLNALDLQFNMAHTAWNTGIRNNITF